MFAGVVPELLDLLRVAQKADLVAKRRYVKRGVRVLVTVEAACQFKMGPPCLKVTLAALRDRLLYFRRMTYVTTCTRDIPVLSSGSDPVIDRTRMTFDAIFFCPGELYLRGSFVRIDLECRDQ